MFRGFSIETFEAIAPITNLQNTYTLCDNSIIVPIDIENTEYFLNITMISGDNLETGPSGNFSFFDTGIQTVYIQTEDINNCYSSLQENFEVNTAK